MATEVVCNMTHLPVLIYAYSCPIHGEYTKNYSIWLCFYLLRQLGVSISILNTYYFIINYLSFIFPETFQSRKTADFTLEKVGIGWLYYLHISSQNNSIYSTKGEGPLVLRVPIDLTDQTNTHSTSVCLLCLNAKRPKGLAIDSWVFGSVYQSKTGMIFSHLW